MGHPSPQDIDFLAFGENYATASEWFINNGWDEAVVEEYKRTNAFSSFRKDNYNVILIREPTEYYSFLGAFHICKKYKIFDKTDRVAVHEGMRALVRVQSKVDHDFTTREDTIRAIIEVRRA